MDHEVISESDARPAASDLTETAIVDQADTAVADEAQADTTLDLDQVERDLDDVQAALARLNDGDYWTDEVTGQPLPDDLLAQNPTARTVTPST